jgi:hypothetical protein
MVGWFLLIWLYLSIRKHEKKARKESKESQSGGKPSSPKIWQLRANIKFACASSSKCSACNAESKKDNQISRQLVKLNHVFTAHVSTLLCPAVTAASGTTAPYKAGCLVHMCWLRLALPFRYSTVHLIMTLDLLVSCLWAP